MLKKAMISLALSLTTQTLWAQCGEVVGCQPVCCEVVSMCECTDPGWKWNNCIDPCTYCKAFGNVGAS